MRDRRQMLFLFRFVLMPFLVIWLLFLLWEPAIFLLNAERHSGTLIGVHTKFTSRREGSAFQIVSAFSYKFQGMNYTGNCFAPNASKSNEVWGWEEKIRELEKRSKEGKPIHVWVLPKEPYRACLFREPPLKVVFFVSGMLFITIWGSFLPGSLLLERKNPIKKK